MNIFALSNDPVEAAIAQCNKHVVKMIVETAQLLSSAHPPGIAPYKHTHINHPSARWTRESVGNYKWLVTHGLALCAEYTKRYKRTHKTQAVLEWLCQNVSNLGKQEQTPFAVAIKDIAHHRADPVEAYRAYYITDKRRFARWAPRAAPPVWWPYKENE